MIIVEWTLSYFSSRREQSSLEHIDEEVQKYEKAHDQRPQAYETAQAHEKAQAYETVQAHEKAQAYETVQMYEKVQTYEKVQVYERPQTYERIQTYEKVQTYETLPQTAHDLQLQHLVYGAPIWSIESCIQGKIVLTMIIIYWTVEW